MLGATLAGRRVLHLATLAGRLSKTTLGLRVPEAALDGKVKTFGPLGRPDRAVTSVVPAAYRTGEQESVPVRTVNLSWRP